MNKFVYAFSEGDKSMKDLLGGKGANLSEMTKLGFPIPDGFTVTTDACNNYYDNGKNLSDSMIAEIEKEIEILEKKMDKKLGDNENPLLVSVRSGAKVSMPGMMDTVLNLGLNDVSVEGLAKKSGNAKFAYDSYRRFIMMFADVVIGVDKAFFERRLDKYKEEKGVKFDNELTAEDMKEVSSIFKEIYKDKIGEDFPMDPKEQLIDAIKAVFKSWDNERAIIYRRLNNIASNWGTAVNVQSMVFGNMGDTSGTGVAFTRNPSTGEKGIYGEYLIDAQGEDVVAGVRTPLPITHLEEDMPEVYKEFMELANRLEDHYKDMQDMEFTIEDEKLYFLQTRNGKRTGAAALKIAVDLVEEGVISKEEAILRVDANALDQLLHPTFDTQALKDGEVIGKGLPASPGAAAGKVYFTASDAKVANDNGERVILVRLETSPEDIEGMHAARGILTVRGGMTSHAAVVARGMGTCCVSGCSEITINEDNKEFTLGGYTFKEGDFISLDGSTGNVYGSDIKTTAAEISGNFETFMAWSDEIRTLGVRANADSPKDAITALRFGAEGIGLCRTEHMFFDEDRIFAMRQMITAKTTEQRETALAKILPMQRKDFEGLFLEMKGNPVTIRFLDPPLHEFLPHEDEDIKELADELNITFEELKARVESLAEFNPMMGHRGCRLAVTYPEIAVMQTRAVIEAAINVTNDNNGLSVTPEIMIPLVGDIKELQFVKKFVKEEADRLISESGLDMHYKIGTMIEVPRACVTADEIAKEAEFFSFGTNDLTQMTFGFSRDDAGKFLNSYYESKIFESDPFARLDQNGVGELVKMATAKGKAERPDIKIGICGEHGGEPTSIEFCHNAGLSYVSCSPFRVPIARLAAAQAKLNEK